MSARSVADRLEHRQVPVYLSAVLVGGLIGLVAPGTDSAFEALIYPVLGALLCVTFLQVPFTALRAAFSDRRFLFAALGLNFLVVPVVAFALSRLAVVPRVLLNGDPGDRGPVVDAAVVPDRVVVQQPVVEGQSPRVA